MIGLKGTLNVIDNSGALIAECVNVLKAKSARGMATVGESNGQRVWTNKLCHC
jgi:ribosomal protein L14